MLKQPQSLEIRPPKPTPSIDQQADTVIDTTIENLKAELERMAYPLSTPDKLKFAAEIMELTAELRTKLNVQIPDVVALKEVEAKVEVEAKPAQIPVRSGFDLELESKPPALPIAPTKPVKPDASSLKSDTVPSLGMPTDKEKKIAEKEQLDKLKQDIYNIFNAKTAQKLNYHGILFLGDLVIMNESQFDILHFAPDSEEFIEINEVLKKEGFSIASSLSRGIKEKYSKWKNTELRKRNASQK